MDLICDKLLDSGAIVSQCFGGIVIILEILYESYSDRWQLSLLVKFTWIGHAMECTNIICDLTAES